MDTNRKMYISSEEKQQLEDLYQSYLNNEKVLRMKSIPMHRGSNCFIHSFRVAKLAMKRAARKKNLDYKAILEGALFHDYYLYDWRTDKSLLKGHGKNHPRIASENAKADFNISDNASNIILRHMWPCNIKMFPNTKEARIVSIADKEIAASEALTSRRYKEKSLSKTQAYISSLF